jgi:short chain dehydrogenase
VPESKTLQQSATTDPKSLGPKPNPRQEKIAHPGLTEGMRTKPDHGEESYQGLGRLRDRAAIITGADSGIGPAIALAFAREGADVLLTYLPEEEEDANETGRWIEKAGRKAVKIPGDLRQEQHCETVIDCASRSLENWIYS